MTFQFPADSIWQTAGFYLDFVNPERSVQTLAGSPVVTPIDPTVFLNTTCAQAYLTDATGKLSLSPGGTSLPVVYSRTGERHGIRPQRSRTNLALQSATLTSGPSQGTTPSAGQSHRDPLGGNGMVAFYEDASNGSHGYATANIAISGSANYAWAIFVRPGNRTQVRVGINDGTTVYYMNVDLITGQLISSSGLLSYSIENHGDGLYRLCAAAIVGAGATTASGFIQAIAGGTVAYAGTNGAVAFYAYGAQFELGSNSSSYIPTTTAAVTRSGDIIKVDNTTLPQFFDNNLEFTVFGRMIPRQETNILAAIYLNTPGKSAHRLSANPEIGSLVQAASYDNAMASQAFIGVTGQNGYSPRGQIIPIASRFSSGNRKVIAGNPDNMLDGSDLSPHTIPTIQTSDAEFHIGRLSETTSIGAHCTIQSIGLINRGLSDDKLRLLLAA